MKIIKNIKGKNQSKQKIRFGNNKKYKMENQSKQKIRYENNKKY